MNYEPVEGKKLLPKHLNVMRILGQIKRSVYIYNVAKSIDFALNKKK